MNKLLLFLPLLFLIPGQVYAADWYDRDWANSRAINIDSGDFDIVLTDYPVFVDISVLDIGVDTQTDCDDIVFTESTNVTKLSHEIERCDTDNDILEAWIKIPSISNTTDTKIIMYYDNPGVTDQQDTQNVWNSDFKFVAHLNGTFLDSTASPLTCTDTTTSAVSNEFIGDSRQWDGANDNIACGTTSDTKTDDIFDGGGTVSFWSNANSQGEDNTAVILRKGLINNTGNYNEGWVIRYSTLTSTLYFAIYESDYAVDMGIATERGLWRLDTRPALNTWNLIHLTFNDDSTSNDPIFYVNGVESPITEQDTPDGTPFSSDQNYIFCLGNGLATNSTCEPVPADGDTFDGELDEFRFYDETMSAEWAKADYECQSASGCISSISSEDIGFVMIEPRFFESDGVTVVTDGSVLQENSTGSRTVSVNATGYASIDGLLGLQNFTFITNQGIHVNKTFNFNAFLDDTFDANGFIHRVSCPSNGVGNDVKISVNASQFTSGNDSHFVASQTTPTCAVDDDVTWTTTLTPNGENTGQISTLISAEILTPTDFGINSDLVTVNSTTISSSYSEPHITSSSFIAGQETDSLSLSFLLSLAMPNPSEEDTGAGSSGSGSFTGTSDPLFTLEVTQPQTPNLLFGESKNITLSIIWDESDDLIVNNIELQNNSPLEIKFPDFPITLKGNPEVTSVNGKFSIDTIFFEVKVPQKCNTELIRTGTTCIESDLYKIPLKVFTTVATLPNTDEISLFINVQNELFLPFIALGSVGGIVVIGLVGRAVYKSRGKTKDGTVLRKLRS